MVPSDRISSALHGATHSSNGTMIRQLPVNSATALNAQACKFTVVYVEDDLHGLAANLTILNVGLRTGGKVDNDAHRLRTVRTADRLFQKPATHV